MAKDIIKESTSEYTSPIVLIKKKNGDIKIYIDFRILNKIVAHDNFFLPLIENQLAELAGKNYYIRSKKWIFSY